MEQRLKERLFGAVIVVSVFVIFLPMVLKEPEAQTISPHEIKSPPPMKAKVGWLEVPESLARWQGDLTTEVPKDTEEANDTWMVQVATFANKKNALKLKSKLEAKGYQTFLEPVPDHRDTLTWLMVGPHLQKEQALAAQIQLKSDFNVKGLIVSSHRRG